MTSEKGWNTPELKFAQEVYNACGKSERQDVRKIAELIARDYCRIPIEEELINILIPMNLRIADNVNGVVIYGIEPLVAKTVIEYLKG